MSFARDLRNNATSEERALWSILGRVRPHFTRQLKIGPFVADFACRKARLIVELDGSQHVDSAADIRRTTMLEADGWRVLRFWNTEVRANVAGVAKAIGLAVETRLPDDTCAAFMPSRAGRVRRPRKKEEPPPTPPRSRGGE